MGLSHEEFWNATDAEIDDLQRAFAATERSRRALAWETAWLSRVAKFPSLLIFLGEEQPNAPLTREEIEHREREAQEVEERMGGPPK